MGIQLRAIACLLACLLGLSGHAALAQELDANEVSKVRLIGESAKAAPGQTVLLGLHFELADHWHIYWDGRNDTGFPATVDWTLPEGVSVGPMLWPTPSRYISPGNILDHVYEGRPTILVPLTIDADVEVGTKLTISGQVEWLVCRDVCLPGFGAVSLDLEIAAPSNEPQAKLSTGPIAEAIRRLPVPIVSETPDGGLSLQWQDPVVVVGLPHAVGLSFHPAMESTTLAFPIEDAHAQASELRLRLSRPERDLGTGGERRLVGIIEGHAADGTSIAYQIDFGPDGLREPRHARETHAAQQRLRDPPAWWPMAGAR